MKLGLGLYRHMLTADNFRFAQQAGATHIIAHLTEYFQQDDSLGTASGGDAWGVAGSGEPWPYETLRDLRAAVEAEGLTLEAIENFDPGQWYDVLLDGPQRDAQIASLQQTIRNMGRAGIPIMGYNFSIAGVWGRVNVREARGEAESPAFLGADGPVQTPIPNGQVWNMIYDRDAEPGTVGTVTSEQLWDRVERFLQELVPVAEEAGVRLAAHPDDPPLPTLRGAARLVHQPSLYQRLLDLAPSRANALEFCLGTLAEMSEGNVYDATEQYAAQDAIAYVHCRNVRGRVPRYAEVFIDEGDIDIPRVLRILHDQGFDGAIIPDHTPQMACAAPWHAGMAHALGYLQAAIQMIERK